jgi:hypothetical protein
MVFSQFNLETSFSFPRASVGMPTASRQRRKTFRPVPFLVPTRQRENAVCTALTVLDGLVVSLVRRKLVSGLAPLARCLLHSHAGAWERVIRIDTAGAWERVTNIT